MLFLVFTITSNACTLSLPDVLLKRKRHRLTLDPLVSLSRLGSTRLLPFYLSRVARQVTFLLHSRPHRRLDFLNRARHGHAHRFGLAGDTATLTRGFNVKHTNSFRGNEWCQHHVPVGGASKVVYEWTLVYGDPTITFRELNGGGRRFPRSPGTRYAVH